MDEVVSIAVAVRAFFFNFSTRAFKHSTCALHRSVMDALVIPGRCASIISSTFFSGVKRLNRALEPCLPPRR